MMQDESKRCSWSIGRKYRFPADTSSRKALCVLTLLRYVEQEWFQRLSHVYALADGSFLGAWRNGGFIAGDTDVDIFLFLKPSQTRQQWITEVRSALPGGFSMADISSTRRLGQKAAPRLYSTRGHVQLTSSRTASNCTMDISLFEVWCLEQAEAFLLRAYGVSYRKPH
eukprot:RCo008386